MITIENDIQADVRAFSERIGRDRLLVQGAGGNISWKNGGSLWIKASGTWLADALESAIFVEVDLIDLNSEIELGRFDSTPKLLSSSSLKPSIETYLHALMPQRVVAHLHAVDVLAHLVRDDCEELISSKLSSDLQWALVDYFKPGSSLALGVAKAISADPLVQVVFLKNHGVVIGGGSTREVDAILQILLDVFSCVPKDFPTLEAPSQIRAKHQLVDNSEIQLLATESFFFERLEENWCLYPDHAVFLGASPAIFLSLNQLEQVSEDSLPEIAFVKGVGVFSLGQLNRAKLAQLLCYRDVLARQPVNQPLTSLKSSEVLELLNWDAEKYRMTLAK